MVQGDLQTAKPLDQRYQGGTAAIFSFEPSVKQAFGEEHVIKCDFY